MTLKSDSRPWFKERWPWILMAGPAVVIVAGIVTVWLAVRSNDGLVTDDYYKQGLTVNQRLLRDHQASSLGLNANVMRSGLNIRLLLGSDGYAMLPTEIVIKLAHPTQSGRDQSVKMVAEGQGFYVGKLSGDLVGRWHISIEDPAGQWRLQGDWKVDAEEPLHIVAGTGK